MAATLTAMAGWLGLTSAAGSPSIWSVRGTAAYEGISSDYDAVTGKVWLNIPFN